MKKISTLMLLGLAFGSIQAAPYSQPATAKLLICRKKTSFGVSKFSFLRGLRLILC